MQPEAIHNTLKTLLKRPADSHKYQYGHVLVIGGSPGFTGAPQLAALAALRTGAGLVTLASPTGSVLAPSSLELMTYTLPDHDVSTAVSDTLHFIEERKVSTVVLGSGLDNTAATYVRALLTKLKLPTVVDAGGITAFQDHLQELDRCTAANSQLIFTPHAGEYQKLSGHKPAHTLPERSHLVHQFAQQHHMTLLLKGQPTLVAATSRTDVYQNHTGNPGLATAGTGDVLSGVIAGLCAQGLEPPIAACAGAYLHGLAADLAVLDKTEPGLIASDVIDYLPAAFTALPAIELQK